MRYLMGQDLKQPFYSGADRVDTRLNSKAPFGLYLSHAGNKYIVTEDFETKIAIVLEHATIPQFSWRALGKKTLDSCEWQGPFWLSATKAAFDQKAPMSLGTIEVGAGFAGLDCEGPDGEINSINLGYAGTRSSHFCEYDGWAVHTLTSDRPVFAKSPPKSQSKRR
jgi:hypothetical protein